jgi:deazaflavin-dependent oxidoreductase (nitroreductase family)
MLWLTLLQMKLYTWLNVRVFKWSRGALWNKGPTGRPICVVGKKGKKSGKWREIALMYLPYGDHVLLVASQGGLNTHPIWYNNLRADPHVEITVAGTTRSMRARQASEEEKRELWPHLIGLYPSFDQYQARTDRNIPVFICEPVC